MRSDGATYGCYGCLPTRLSKRMPATSLTLLVAHLTLLVAHLTLLVAHLTLLVAHRVREQVKVQVQRSGKMKTWGGFRT